MLPRHRPNPERENTATNERDSRERNHEIPNRLDGRGAFCLDLHGPLEETRGLARVECLLTTLDGGDEIAPLLERLAHAREHVELHRGVDQTGDDEDENDCGSDEEKLTVEAHSGN